MTDHPIPPSPDRRFADGFEAGIKVAADYVRRNGPFDLGQQVAALTPPAQPPQSAGWTCGPALRSLLTAAKARDNLLSNQRQLDIDGHEVGVSRQALEEVLTYLAERETFEAPSQSALDQTREEGAMADDSDIVAEMQRLLDHFESWARDHSPEATAETWAIIYCSRAALNRRACNAPPSQG